MKANPCAKKSLRKNVIIVYNFVQFCFIYHHKKHNTGELTACWKGSCPPHESCNERLVNTRWGEVWIWARGARLRGRDNFVWALLQLCPSVCRRESHNCCCRFISPTPLPRVLLQPVELEESFHLRGNERMGSLWGGEAEEVKLQSGAVWQTALSSDPLSWHHLESERKAIFRRGTSSARNYCKKW